MTTDSRKEQLREELSHLEDELAHRLELFLTGAQELEHIEAREEGRKPRSCSPVFHDGRVVIERGKRGR